MILCFALADLISPFASNSADTITQSIATILHPHTSSPSLQVISQAMANLMMTNFSSSGLELVWSAHLDSLAVSPQAKQGIIPALLGIAKFTEGHVQPPRCEHPIPSYVLLISRHVISFPVLLSHRL